MNNKELQHKTGQNKTRILVVNGRPAVRQELIRLINQENDLSVCVEAGSANQALDAIDKRQVDLAIVDISLAGASGVQLAEKIRLRCPNLPVLILSMHDEALCAKRALRAKGKGCVESNEATEQILKAVRYIQSLLRSNVFGFTVLVKIERSG